MTDEAKKNLEGWTFLGELTPEEEEKIGELTRRDRELTFQIGHKMREVFRLIVSSEQVTAKSSQVINGATMERYGYQGMLHLVDGKTMYRPSSPEDAMLVMGAPPEVKETPSEEGGEQEDI